MTVLFSSNFDSGSGVISPATGFTTAAGAGLREQDVSSSEYTSASRAIGRDSFGDAAYVTSVGQIGNVGIRTAIKWNSQHTTPAFIGHLFRSNSTTGQCYHTQVFSNGTSAGVLIYKVNSGSTELAFSGYTLAISSGDVLHHETKMIGSVIESRIWKNSEARPTTATVTATDSTFSTGYVGLRRGWSSGMVMAFADDLVITDGTGGEDYFYPESSTPTATVTATTALPSFSGSAQVAPVTSITVTTALPAFSGGASTGSASATVTATTSLPSYSGGATGDTSQGTLTLPVLKNNAGTVLANETGATVHVYEVSTGNKVVTKTGQTTDSSGVMTVTDALIVRGTQYRVVVVLESGAEGLAKVTAS